MKKIILSLALLLNVAANLAAQNVGIGTTAPDASALLELKANNKGFLPPRMTAAEKTGIATPKAGLMIYQTDGAAGLYIFNGTVWVISAVSTNSWMLNGNAGTDPINNFIGTTDAKPLVFRAGNNYAGRISNDGMVALGTGAAAALSDASIVAIGKDALLYNGTGATGLEGKNNTAIGSAALTKNTKGFFNTATGFQALNANTTGNYNTANGVQALLNNTTGYFNTANGIQALYHNISGTNNTANGNGALYQNTSGSFNTAIGDNAMLLNTGGDINTALGINALLSNTVGSNNTGLGYKTLNFNSTGNNNTAIGSNALYSNETGHNNTAIGRGADVTMANLTNATAVGAAAKVGCSNCLVLGASGSSDLNRVNVGIGVQNPQSALHIDPNGNSGSIAGGIFIGKNRTAGGYTGLGMGITNVAGGGAYLQAVQASGSLWGNLLLNPDGGKVGIGYNNPTSIQYPLDINQSDEKGIRLTNGDAKWEMASLGSFYFSHNGNVKAAIYTVDGSYHSLSDARLKKDVNKMGSVLDKVMALQPKTYKYLDNNETDRASSGFIAQEVIPLFPELVSDFQHPVKDTVDNTVYHGINYAGFGVVAIKAIQEQQQQIEKLNTDNQVIQSQMKLLKAENNQLLQQMGKMQAAIDAINKK